MFLRAGKKPPKRQAIMKRSFMTGLFPMAAEQ